MEELKKILKSGGDVHAKVASRLFGVPTKDVTEDQRAASKNILFCELYGGSSAAKLNDTD